MVDPARETEIKAREDAIKRKLDVVNNQNRTTAMNSIDSKKGGTASYGTQVIAGAKSGYNIRSDYGAGTGAAIPYTVEASAGTVSKNKPAPPKPPVAKPPVASGGHTNYKVQKGDTLSGIAKKTGSSVKAIWDYNLKNRSAKTQKVLKTRGKNLIYRGGTFYIPK